MSESLLEKYPHLKLLTKLKKAAGLPPHPAPTAREMDGQAASLPSEGRISLLGPGVGNRAPLVPLQPHPLHGAPLPRLKVCAEDLFAASLAADEDQWLQFHVEENVPAKQQLDQLKMWLMANKPSTIARSSRVGWIAVKFKDKGKKVLEAKAAWDCFAGEKSMEVVNQLAEEFKVEGGKWLCHLPTGMIDQVWSKLATTLMCGGLGPSVYMVKVSPVEDINPEQARGEHVLIVYNTNYKDTEQVMRVENLMRSAGVTTILNYKPDIFSALGIYRNNKWGFRPTIYCSRVLLMEGKSRVETVGTGKWYYNSSKGLLCPVEKKDASCGEETGKENKIDDKQDSVDDIKKVVVSKNKDVKVPEFEFVMGKMDDMKTCVKSHEGTNAQAIVAQAGRIKLDMRSLDELKDNSQNTVGQDVNGNSEFIMDDMEAMKMKGKPSTVQISEGKLEKKGSKLMINEKNCLKKVDIEGIGKARGDQPRVKDMNILKESRFQREVGEEGKKVVHEAVTELNIQEAIIPRNPVKHADKKTAVKKPAWLMKLEQLQMKSLDEMSKTS